MPQEDATAPLSTTTLAVPALAGPGVPARASQLSKQHSEPACPPAALLPSYPDASSPPPLRHRHGCCGCCRNMVRLRHVQRSDERLTADRAQRVRRHRRRCLGLLLKVRDAAGANAHVTCACVWTCDEAYENKKYSEESSRAGAAAEPNLRIGTVLRRSCMVG